MNVYLLFPSSFSTAELRYRHLKQNIHITILVQIKAEMNTKYKSTKVNRLPVENPVLYLAR